MKPYKSFPNFEPMTTLYRYSKFPLQKFLHFTVYHPNCSTYITIYLLNNIWKKKYLNNLTHCLCYKYNHGYLPGIFLQNLTTMVISGTMFCTNCSHIFDGSIFILLKSGCNEWRTTKLLRSCYEMKQKLYNRFQQNMKTCWILFQYLHQTLSKGNA